VKLKILAIDSKRPEWVRKAFYDYERRFDRSIKIEWCSLGSVRGAKNLDKSTLIEKESEKLLSYLKEGETLISLDREGTSWNTIELKEKFEEWMSLSLDISFVIGGPDGLSSSCLKKSEEVWSLSPLTFPHSIIPVLIIEQLYRAWSIVQNHPYHR
tara:strand:- start:1599 stop:2066 length:468 start_codon:yes stop_codon:yes gene_type:complete